MSAHEYEIIRNRLIRLSELRELERSRGIPTHEDIPALLWQMTKDISYIAQTMRKWEFDRQEDNKQVLRGRLFTSTFRLTPSFGSVHMDLLDEQYDRNIPAGAIINRPYAKARNISITNMNPLGITSKIHVQTNSKPTDARPNTDLKSADGIELDGRDHRGRPRLESIDLELIDGSFADVRIVVYA